jgi:hypothetical protein
MYKVSCGLLDGYKISEKYSASIFRDEIGGFRNEIGYTGNLCRMVIMDPKERGKEN